MPWMFSTCLLRWQGKEVGYSWNSPTFTWPWIWPKWPMEGICVPQWRKYNIWSRNIAPRSEKRRSGVLSFLGITWSRMWQKVTRLWLVETIWPDAFLAKMALQHIRRHTGDRKGQVHLCPTKTDRWLQSGRHLCMEQYLPQPVTLLELNVPISLLRWPDLRIHILLNPVLNSLLLVHLPRIASRIQILIQICWLMKEHPPVSTLSAVL